MASWPGKDGPSDQMCEDKENKQHCIQNERKLTCRAFEEHSVYYGMKDGLEIRKLNMHTQHKDIKFKVQKLFLGIPTHNTYKVILLVGATGSGKTTLINSMVNYIYRVEFSDNFRFILIDDNNAEKRNTAESQTDLITAYVFYHMDGMPFDYNYILIDTPGFGDTRGIQRDKEMMKQLEKFLKQGYGINSVDCVGCVTPSSAARLTHTQRYVYEGITSMFGKDIKNNIYVMATFADAKRPKVLRALKNADIDYAGIYKFNNSALFAKNKDAESSDNNGESCYKDEDSSDNDGESLYEVSDSDDDNDDDDDDEDAVLISKVFWEMGYKSMNNLFIKLSETEPASLTLTKEVLEERSKLEVIIYGLQNEIQYVLGKLETLKQERLMLDRLDDDMKGSANYTEEIDVRKYEKINVKKGTFVTNCRDCLTTCHYPCTIKTDEWKGWCWAMKGNNCTVCFGKCHYTRHTNMEYQYKHTIVKEKRAIEELLNRYNKAKQGKLTKNQVIKEIEDDINNNAENLKNMIKTAQEHITRLEEIALKPNPLSTKEYIQLMIEAEILHKSQNYEKRIKLLETLNKEASILQWVKEKSQTPSGNEIVEDLRNMAMND